jgi:Tfp pilus assembly protein PilF
MKTAAATCLLALSLPAFGSPRLDFARGVLAERRGDPAAARLAFERARAADPVAMPLMRRVAGLRQAAGDLAGASTLYREFAASRPERLDAQLAYADFLREASPDDDFASKLALEVLERAAARFPGAAGLSGRRFRLYENLGQRDRSLALFEQVAARPEGALEAVGMARSLFAADDAVARERVDGLLRDACRREPADPVLARAASEHFRTSGRLPEAVAILADHAAAAPASLELRVRLGILQLAAGRAEDGERTLRELLAIDPRQALAHQALAKLYRKQQRPAEARPHAAQRLKLRGGEPAEFVTLAEEFLAAGDAREARLLLEKAVFHHPSDPQLAAKLAVASRRDPASRGTASRLFREAENLAAGAGPGADPVFLQEFAESLLEAGQTSAAEQRLRAAIRAFPAERKSETAAALRRLAGIWRQEGRNEEAAEALRQRADALDPP